MFKWLGIIGSVLVLLTLIALGIGLTQQQPFMFGLAILCLMPLGAFFMGGALFNLAANYSIQPKAGRAKAGGRLGNARTGELA